MVKNYEVVKDKNNINVYINTVPRGISSNPDNLTELTVYKRLAGALKNVASRFFSINMTLDETADPKKIVIKERSRMTSFSIDINDVPNAFSEKDFYNSSLFEKT